MSEETEPVAAGPTSSLDGPVDANAPAPAYWPEPFGILGTFAWALAATSAAALSGTAFVLATGYWKPPNDTNLVLFAWVAATIGQVAFFAVIVWACRRRRWPAIDYLGLVRPQGRFVRASSVVFLLAVTVSVVAAKFGPLMDRSSPVDALPPVILFVEIAVMAPITEELVFRGFIYRGLAASRLGITPVILVTSLLWAGVHFDRTWLGLADIFFCGLCLGWLRWRSDSTITPLAVHGFNNALAVIAPALW